MSLILNLLPYAFTARADDGTAVILLSSGYEFRAVTETETPSTYPHYNGFSTRNVVTLLDASNRIELVHGGTGAPLSDAEASNLLGNFNAVLVEHCLAHQVKHALAGKNIDVLAPLNRGVPHGPRMLVQFV